METKDTIVLCASSIVLTAIITKFRADIRHKRSIKKARHIIDVQGMKINCLAGVITEIADGCDPVAVAQKFEMNKEFIDLIGRAI